MRDGEHVPLEPPTAPPQKCPGRGLRRTGSCSEAAFTPPQRALSVQTCSTVDGRPLTEETYGEIVAAARSITTIKPAIATVQFLARCGFVDRAFEAVVARDCGSMLADTGLLFRGGLLAGLSLTAAALFLCCCFGCAAAGFWYCCIYWCCCSRVAPPAVYALLPCPSTAVLCSPPRCCSTCPGAVVPCATRGCMPLCTAVQHVCQACADMISERPKCSTATIAGSAPRTHCTSWCTPDAQGQRVSVCYVSATCRRIRRMPSSKAAHQSSPGDADAKKLQKAEAASAGLDAVPTSPRIQASNPGAFPMSQPGQNAGPQPGWSGYGQAPYQQGPPAQAAPYGWSSAGGAYGRSQPGYM